jgi:hypothetical protein
VSTRPGFRRKRLASIPIWLWLLLVGVAHYQGTPATLTFDEFTLTSPGDTVPVPNGYGNLQWDNFYILNGLRSAQHPSGFENALVSPDNFIWNGNANPAQISSVTTFDLNSAYMTADWMDGLQIEAQGFVGGTLQYDNTYTINTTSPTLVTFNYFGVNQVTFIGSGGTQHLGYNGSGPVFAIDNMTVRAPEPSAISLSLLAMACVSVISRRR